MTSSAEHQEVNRTGAMLFTLVLLEEAQAAAARTYTHTQAVYTHIHTFMHARAQTHTHARACIHTHTCTHVHMYANKRILTHITGPYLRGGGARHAPLRNPSHASWRIHQVRFKGWPTPSVRVCVCMCVCVSRCLLCDIRQHSSDV